jgi:hypothetical protein
MSHQTEQIEEVELKPTSRSQQAKPTNESAKPIGRLKPKPAQIQIDRATTTSSGGGHSTRTTMASKSRKSQWRRPQYADDDGFLCSNRDGRQRAKDRRPRVIPTAESTSAD